MLKMEEKEMLSNKCPYCGSNHVEYITRVTGFFSKIGSWNKGKIAELRDRRSAIETNRKMLSDVAGLSLEDEKTKRIKLFWKNSCPRCPEAKAIAKKLAEKCYSVDYYNIETTEGLAEASLHMVLATPTMVLVDENDEEIAAWRGITPGLSEVEEAL
ncbi:MAG TPA: hypothetical protein ENH24_03935 [Nitrospirae bacterium]|nr:hypothetical protein [Nitrospirota bacterium]